MDHVKAQAMATDWSEFDSDGSAGESPYERAKGNLAKCYLEAMRFITVMAEDGCSAIGRCPDLGYPWEDWCAACQALDFLAHSSAAADTQRQASQ